jgi:ribosomal protein S18 acetylase RimI-like enzyme
MTTFEYNLLYTPAIETAFDFVEKNDHFYYWKNTPNPKVIFHIQQDVLVGYILYHLSSDSEGQAHCVLDYIWVHPDHRLQGHGKSLIQHLQRDVSAHIIAFTHDPTSENLLRQCGFIYNEYDTPFYMYVKT